MMHTYAFSGVQQDVESHLLDPGKMRDARNLFADSMAAVKRPGFVPVLAFTGDTDYKLLWPTCLPCLSFSERRMSAAAAAAGSDPYLTWQGAADWHDDDQTYTERRDALEDAYTRGSGVHAMCHNLGGVCPEDSDRYLTDEEYTWTTTLFGFSR